MSILLLKEGKKQIKLLIALKICDPAVGSGHFLVSCLNEIIAIKADLRILNDREGRQIRDYSFVIENDELVITDEVNEELFSYNLNPSGKPITSKQELQETLFHEKETIIENCLFGVDINSNSVNICRLRLWIELLKNAYYTKQSNYTELETLPNIDINIKQGNSLISKFDIDQNIFASADKRNLEIYKLNVHVYKNEQDKDKRRDLKEAIEKTKARFKGFEIDALKKEKSRLDGLVEQLHKLNSGDLFASDLTVEQLEKNEKKRKSLEEKIDKLKNEIDTKEEEYLKIYSDAFEWRFEFPEVLNDEGEFIGFDVVIGNPPYISLSKFKELNDVFSKYSTFSKTGDIYCLFYEKGLQILRSFGVLTYITSNSWMRTKYGKLLRDILLNKLIH